MMENNNQYRHSKNSRELYNFARSPKIGGSNCVMKIMQENKQNRLQLPSQGITRTTNNSPDVLSRHTVNRISHEKNMTFNLVSSLKNSTDGKKVPTSNGLITCSTHVNSPNASESVSEAFSKRFLFLENKNQI